MSTLSRSESKDGEGAGHDAEAWVQLRGLGLRVLPLGLHIENRSRAPGVWVCGVSAVVLGPCPRTVRMATVLIPGRCSLLPDALSGETTRLVNWGCFSSR